MLITLNQKIANITNTNDFKPAASTRDPDCIKTLSTCYTKLFPYTVFIILDTLQNKSIFIYKIYMQCLNC